MSLSETLYARSLESLEGVPPGDFMALVTVKTEQAISLEGLYRRLQDGQPLNVKFGTDPTGPDLHLGHLVPIIIFDLFSRAGHNADLIFGDVTAAIGDPSGRSSERPLLTEERILENMSTFRAQIDRFVSTDRANVRVHRQGEWLGKMLVPEFLRFLRDVNMTEASQRRDFRTRMERGDSVSMAEGAYGTLMGIDSAHLRTDVEIGGLDQLLNFHQARAVQERSGQRPEEVIMTPILPGTTGDGRKMSKSFNNYVPLRVGAEDMYGMIMSIPDSLIATYIMAMAPVYIGELPEIYRAIEENPHAMKHELATYMAAKAASSYDGGLQAREAFQRRFATKELTDADYVPLPFTEGALLVDTLAGTGKTRGDLKRLAEQGGIRVNGERIGIEELLAGATPPGAVVTIGKRGAFKISTPAPAPKKRSGRSPKATKK